MEKKGNDIKENEAPYESRIQSVLGRFMERTSMHGCGYIKSSRHRLSKLFWVMVTSLAVCMLTVHLYMVFTQFLRRPINTKVSLGFSNLRFPAITVCNINVMRCTERKKYSSPQLLELIEAVNPDNILNSYGGFLDNHTDCVNQTHHEHVEDFYRDKNVFKMSPDFEVFRSEHDDEIDDWLNERSLQSFTWTLFRFLYMKLPRESRRDAGHQLPDMLLSCSFNDKMCYESNFSLYQTPTYGNCYTLDSDHLVARIPGQDGGLSLTFYLQTEEFLKGIANGYGVKLIVHEPGTKALPDQEGIYIAANTETSIGLKKTTVERLGTPYGQCCDGKDFEKKYGIKYNVKVCIQACFANYIWTGCNCWYYMHELIALSSNQEFNICNTTEEITCMAQALVKFNRKEIECDCQQTCSDIYYTESVSSRQWPSETYAELLKKVVCSSNSRACRKSFQRKEHNGKNFLRLNIFYETLNFESVQEEPLVDTFTFLSSIGGALGLWIGLSMLSVCEVLQLGMEILTCVFYKCIGVTDKHKYDL